MLTKLKMVTYKNVLFKDVLNFKSLEEFICKIDIKYAYACISYLFKIHLTKFRVCSCSTYIVKVAERQTSKNSFKFLPQKYF